jgi:hypothetical protein
MMKGKRMVLWALVGLLALGLVGCGGTGSEAEEGEEPSLEEAAQETTGEEPAQVDEPTEGDETTEGGAKGSEDESLEELGGGYVYRREGGIAGFCDVVTVLAGTATVASCATDPPEVVSEVTLTAEQSQQVLTWLEELKTFDYENADKAVADAMTVSIVFNGEGDNEATDEDITAMEALALEVLSAPATQ